MREGVGRSLGGVEKCEGVWRDVSVEKGGKRCQVGVGERCWVSVGRSVG